MSCAVVEAPAADSVGAESGLKLKVESSRRVLNDTSVRLCELPGSPLLSSYSSRLVEALEGATCV